MTAGNGASEPKKRRERGHGVPTKPVFRTLDDADGRCRAIQAARRLMAEMESDLADNPTTGQRTLLSRAAALHAWLSDRETAFYETGKLDLAGFCKASSELRLLLMSVGIAARETKPGGPPPMTIEQYAAQRGIIR